MLVSSRRAAASGAGRRRIPSLSLSLSLSSLLSLNLFFVCKNKPINLRVDLSLDHVGRFLNGANLLGPFFVERDFELFFQRHHDFDGVQRIRAQVDKLGVRRDGVEVRAKLFGDDASDLVESVARLRVVVG